MAHYENIGLSDEWYTPKYIFDALNVQFITDVASPTQKTHVPALNFITENSLQLSWENYGFIWMNPPFGKRMGIVPWIDKFINHSNGIALAPDRSSVSWWQRLALNSDAVLFVSEKIKFERPDGSIAKHPSTGTTLFAMGEEGVKALETAEKNGLGIVMTRKNCCHDT